MSGLLDGHSVAVFGRLVNGSLRERMVHNGCYPPADLFTLPTGTLLRPQCHWVISFSDFTPRIVVQFQHKAIRHNERSRQLKPFQLDVDQTRPIFKPP